MVSIAITPQAPTIALGTSQQFTATGTYTDGSSQNLTGTVTWTSSATSIATISGGGLATSLAQGSVTITAVSGTITGSATLTVTAATLTSISVTPAKESLAAGHTHQYTATGTYSNGTTQNLTTEVTWTSSAPSVATVRSNTGLVTGVAAGTTTITAESGTISGSATLTVTETLTSISITPTTASVVAGYTDQFTATGTYSNGTTQNLTSTATWTSSAMSISTVSGGLAAGLAQGIATITATSGTISGSATLTVAAPVLTSISVTPTATSVPAGNLQQFTATGLYSNGTTQNLTSTLTWASSAAPVATIGSSGLATGVAQGTTTITANSGTISGSATLTITNATGSISSFQHVIVIVQENRTPDNLFQGLCSPPYGSSTSCSSSPSGSQYDIQTGNWLDKTSSTNTTQPVTVALANDYDLNHDHAAFTAMCDVDATGVCLMDSAADVSCSGTCPTRPQFAYVDNSTGLLDPYLTIATQYGWANYMFQTNQGPSFPAHQFLFGGTSAPSAADDAAAIFAAENMAPVEASAGCTALEGTTVTLVGPAGENPTLYPAIYPCFERQTMADLFDSNGVSWKYYAPAAGSIWTAPNAIQHLCVPSAPTGGKCTGSDWTNDVVLNPTQVLTDIGNCNLDQVSWVIPSGQNSDHANGNSGGGPSWVASIVNAIGNNRQCKDGEVYWNNTAILITWDDWGGWYDHEPPTFLGEPQGDYQYGFRVPLLVVSAYTPAAYVDNNRMDFGTILRFLEHNFSIEEGSLNFADARTQIDLTEFFNLNQAPRPFQIVPAPLDAEHFLNDKTPPTDPDDD
ncbi:MAG: Ig-like domain-containing protein [Bryobacteraceae bacterium]